MKIIEITSKSLFESFLNIDVAALGIEGIVDAADEALDAPAATAIDSFVGMPANAYKNGYEFGIMQSRALEDAYSTSPSDTGKLIKNQLTSAVEPIKSALKSKFGDKIKLYRGQGDIKNSNKLRNILSWTSNYQVAQFALGINPNLINLKPVSNQEIESAIKKYNKTGEIKFGRKLYKKTDQLTNDSSVDEFYYEILDSDGNLITDGDNIREELLNYQQFKNNIIAKRDALSAKILEIEIPIDRIIWITNRANQSEFIIHNKQGAVGFVDHKGNM